MNKLPATLTLGLATTLALAISFIQTAHASEIPAVPNTLDVSALVNGRPMLAWLDETEISGLEARGANKVLLEAGPRLMPALSRVLLEDKSSERQAKAAFVMSGIGYRNPGASEVHQAVPALTIGAQCTNDSEVRIYSLQALGAIGAAASNAIPIIIQRTRDQNDSVRLCAAEALGRIGATSPEALTALKACLADDRSGDVRSLAAKALQKLQAKLWMPGNPNPR